MLADTLVLKYDVELAEARAVARAEARAEARARYEERLREEKKQTAMQTAMQTAIQIALELKNDGLSIESIAKATKLPMHEIECL